MNWATPIAFGVAGGGMAVFILLTVYLELRIHAVVQSGDSPKETMKVFRRRWDGFNNYGYDIKGLFSQRFKDIDSHTRRLVSIIRVALVIAVTGFLASAVLLVSG